MPYNNQASSLAYGMGASEQVAYDTAEKYVYSASEQGFINVIDYNDATAPVFAAGASLEFPGESLTDVEICQAQGLLWIASSPSKLSPGKVYKYRTKKRLQTDIIAPVLVATYDVGYLPDMLTPNSDCTKIAVANEGEGVYRKASADYTGPGIVEGLVDPAGSISLIDVASGTVSSVSLKTDAICMTDAECKAKSVHLPLEYEAMVYFDTQSATFASDLNFTAAIAAYSVDQQLEPEYAVFSSDGTKLYVNLQENSALVTIDVASATATRIDAYPLKDWTTTPIDTVKDGGCTLANKTGFRALRMPDSISIANVDGRTYIIAADEGDDKEYGAFEEKQKVCFTLPHCALGAWRKRPCRDAYLRCPPACGHACTVQECGRPVHG